jgi:hypothetical protein
MPITMHPGNPLSLRQLAVLVAVLYLVASAVLVLKWWMRQLISFRSGWPRIAHSRLSGHRGLYGCFNRLAGQR